MDNSFKVFLASTSDLHAERQAALRAIRQMRLEHNSMEFFGARTNTPLDTCLEEVKASDILILVVGSRYGSIVPGEVISYTEAEYRRAFDLNRPILVYISADLQSGAREAGGVRGEATNLERFLEVLHGRHKVEPFRNHNDLANKVVSDLNREVQRLITSKSSSESVQSPTSAILREKHLGFLRQVDVLHEATVYAAGALERIEDGAMKHPLLLSVLETRKDFKRLRDIYDEICLIGSEPVRKLAGLILGTVSIQYVHDFLALAESKGKTNMLEVTQKAYAKFTNELKPQYLEALRQDLEAAAAGSVAIDPPHAAVPQTERNREGKAQILSTLPREVPESNYSSNVLLAEGTREEYGEAVSSALKESTKIIAATTLLVQEINIKLKKWKSKMETLRADFNLQQDNILHIDIGAGLFAFGKRMESTTQGVVKIHERAMENLARAFVVESDRPVTGGTAARRHEELLANYANGLEGIVAAAETLRTHIKSMGRRDEEIFNKGRRIFLVSIASLITRFEKMFAMTKETQETANHLRDVL